MERSAPRWLKPTVEYGPLAAFLLTYFLWDDSGAADALDHRKLMTATLVLIVTTVVAVTLAMVVERRVPKMPLFTAVVVTLFGGLTLLLNDEAFIKMKPTVVQLLFAAILAGGLMMKRPLLKYLLGEAWPMDEEGWRQLSLRFALMFVALGALNEVVWRTQTTDVWVVFKVFGLSGLTLAFALCQIPLLRRHALASEAPETDPPR